MNTTMLFFIELQCLNVKLTLVAFKEQIQVKEEELSQQRVSQKVRKQKYILDRLIIVSTG